MKEDRATKEHGFIYLPLLLCLLLKVYIELYPPVFLTIFARMGIDDGKTDQADWTIGIVVHTAHQFLG